MLVSATTASHKHGNVASLIFPYSRFPSLKDACEVTCHLRLLRFRGRGSRTVILRGCVLQEIELRRQQDWQALLQSTGLTPVDLTLFIQMILLDKYYASDCTDNPLRRWHFEQHVGNVASSYVGSAAAQARLTDAAKRFGDETRSLVLLEALGSVWNSVNEVVPAKPRSAFICARIWRYREPVSVETFQRWLGFDLNARTTYSLLYTILKEEKKLPLIKHLVDVLAWHRVLFSIFRPGSISREEVRVLLVPVSMPLQFAHRRRVCLHLLGGDRHQRGGSGESS
jgi:hypothetical protein